MLCRDLANAARFLKTATSSLGLIATGGVEVGLDVSHGHDALNQRH